jgi:hypothetical protein
VQLVCLRPIEPPAKRSSKTPKRRDQTGHIFTLN